jgi:hypothetical protein
MSNEYYYNNLLNDIAKNSTEILEFGQNELLGLRWAIGEQTLILLGDKEWAFLFFGIFKFWLQTKYFLKRRK